MNLTDILRDHRIPFDISGRNKNRPGWANLKCCFCGRDPYLGINLESLGCSCWNCGPKRITEVLERLTGMPSSELWGILQGLPRNQTIKKKTGGTLVLPNDLGPLQDAHKRYLKKRKFDPDYLVQLWDIQGIGKLGGRLAWRIFIPVHVNGEIVTWTTRRLTNDEPRYISARPEESIIPIDQCMYGIDYCRSACLCVEGCFDVWSLGPGSVSSFGTRVSDAQCECIGRFPLRGILFDAGHGEAAAALRARKLADRLSVMQGTTLRVTLETGNDPASCSASEREEIRKVFRQ